MRPWKHLVHGILIRTLGLGFVTGITVAVVLIGRAPLPEDARYIGSAACAPATGASTAVGRTACTRR